YGSHWSSVSSEELNTPIRSLAAAGSDLIAGTQGAGVVWKRPLSEMITPASVSKEAFVFGYKLEQNYPNPFNPSTVIRYQLPENTLVILKVYDILGKEVVTLVDQLQNAGSHSVTFNTLNLPIGVYFYRLEAGRYHNTRKLLLLK
ncbi:MAG TPA: T9SS type A sorting domain-containing protein, partial [Ignavibacteriaceae bacterium]|nr:T9SS type A sorting domain-containing protein [Ignavibacteriaceae bacterium]